MDATHPMRSKNLLGGVSCEYYPDSSVGLLTYFAVAADQRNKYDLRLILLGT